MAEHRRKITPAKKCKFRACRALDRSYLPFVFLHLKFIICLSWQYIYSCVGVPLCACMHLEQSLWTFCAVEITLEFNYCCYELSTDFCDSVSKMRTQVHSSMADFIVSLDGMALL